MKLKTAALACASTAAMLIVGLAPAASALPVTVAPTLLEAGSVQDDNGVLAVSATSDSAITQITAHFFAQSDDDGTEAATEPETEAGETQDFTLHSGTADSGVWYTSQPVQLAALGDYRTVIELTDADGDRTEAAGGVLDYNYTALFQSFTATPAAPDYFHQEVTVGGRLVVRHPGTRALYPRQSVPVQLLGLDESGAATTATTDADGRFKQVFVPKHDGGVSAYVTGAQTGSPVRIAIAQSATRVTLDAKDVNIKPGQSAKISGKAEVEAAGGVWKPLAGQTVTLDPQGSGDASTTAVTGADGRFTGTTAPQSSKAVNVTVGSDYEGFLAASAVQVARVHVAATTSITGFTASLDKLSQLTVGGTLDTGDRQPDSSKASIEYSKDGRTGWKTVKTLTTGVDADPGSFAGTFAAPGKGYWRAHYKGTPDFGASYSKVLHVTRTATRITGANASPEPVKKGKTITVTGKLQQQLASGAWKAYGSQKVTILFKAKGAATWQVLGTAVTKADGTFKKGFTAKKDGTWQPVLLNPDSAHLVSYGSEDFVDVK